MTCSACGNRLCSADNGTALVCLTCGTSRPVGAPDLGFEDESQLVEAIRKALRTAGFLVERVGQHRADRSGTDAGVSDLLVSHDRWLPYTWAQVEVKPEGEQPTVEQKLKYEAGRLAIVRSVAEALEAVKSVDRRLRGAGKISE